MIYWWHVNYGSTDYVRYFADSAAAVVDHQTEEQGHVDVGCRKP